MRLSALIAALFVLGFSACSSTKGPHGHYVPSSRNFIFADEINSSVATNAYDLIESLRPYWLRGRGPKSVRNRMASNPMAYVDGLRLGNISSLVSLPVHNIVKIEYMNSGDATIRFGTDHPGGAILITMFY
jgi:hypothetical protein